MKKKKDHYSNLESIDVMGTTYQIYFRTEEEDECLESCVGYCDKYLKLIVISDELKEESLEMGSQWEKSHEALQKKILRHELTHAFLTECGLSENSSNQWANNEEMVDFLAINAEKLVRLFGKAGVL